VSVALADTSVFIAGEIGRPMRTEYVPDLMKISVVTIGELRAGVLSASDPVERSMRLDTFTTALQLEALPITTSVAEAWAQLRLALRLIGRRMPVNDSWIAATAMAHGIPVVTQDVDYVSIAGLEVIHI
jgi:predicted nucleic acid-binding protein